MNDFLALDDRPAGKLYYLALDQPGFVFASKVAMKTATRLLDCSSPAPCDITRVGYDCGGLTLYL